MRVFGFLGQRLLAIAQTERTYQASNGTYALSNSWRTTTSCPAAPSSAATRSTATISTTGFRITATPTDPAKADWPTLEITASMQVTER